jgi:hypothetical protein
MQVGLTPSKQEINTQVGLVSARVFSAMRQIREVKYFLDGKTDLELSEVGFEPTEIDAIRSAYTDLDLLARVFAGVVGTQAKDFRLISRRLIGLGDIG